MTIKKMMLVIGAAAMVGATHAETAEHVIQISVPAIWSRTNIGRVEPPGGWGQYDRISFGYDAFTRTLGPEKRIPLEMDNVRYNNCEPSCDALNEPTGAIKASLAFPVVLSDGNVADDIPVDVLIDNYSASTEVKLTEMPQVIYAKKDLFHIDEGSLRIRPKSRPDGGRLAVGHYEGVIALVFDFDPITSGRMVTPT
ncbi:hypothetical protein KDX16_18275 [Burkholderia vietnamiensis]|uniref:hypothetical protein n=1 Tax=Burkholderia vietnamiensis TaxID=60552 RepID=UPI00076CE68A|nr:hypothetical protein [Burkholderia vietnamiensis]KVE93081.1 hypothetical protein WJ01_23020 [Burkholderia vietnamiensis]MBR7917733.1 hypothetical protein [Burkholderia vietnamiensis]